MRYEVDAAQWGAPGLSLGAAYIRGSGIDGSRVPARGGYAWLGYGRGGEHWERDLWLRYTVREGRAKGLALLLRYGEAPQQQGAGRTSHAPDPRGGGVPVERLTGKELPVSAPPWRWREVSSRRSRPDRAACRRAHAARSSAPACRCRARPAPNAARPWRKGRSVGGGHEFEHAFLHQVLQPVRQDVLWGRPGSAGIRRKRFMPSKASRITSSDHWSPTMSSARAIGHASALRLFR
ncbi:outer membrane porin, oprD family domain-containing protein [Ditylenchus destructor]|uniref:Outer membrane porin, oprD family domain-containing protein n=1 Tax=Ditylenchus destructor TaxID=166010 RepID=A0AAD4MJ10_9BILA|nr:outer membrane porin, oprD family domain-containing protein [Ditylenchus destructor]